MLQEGSATEKAKRRSAADTRNWFPRLGGSSGGAIQELLRLRLHVQAGILMRLVARDGGDALHEIEDAFRRAAFLRQHRVDHLGCLGLGEAAATQKLGAILVAACHDPLAGGLDAVDEGHG